MEHITSAIARFVSGFTFEQIPPEALETTRMYIVDYCAAVYAGCRINEKFNRALLELTLEQSASGSATVAVWGNKLCAENAAYLNAAFCHGADMDDGNKKAMGHVAAHTMASVFALAETMDVTWKEVFTAILVGYEVFNRLAGAAQPGIVRRGFHSTGVAGSMASAAACAKLMGLSEHQIYQAISLAALQSSGLLMITESGQACKPLNPANAARNGIVCAKLAKKGIEGPVNPLESKKGWFHAFSETFREDFLLDGLGEKLTIMESYLKPYASCRHTHCGIECALNIRSRIETTRGAIAPDDIQSVTLRIYQNAVTVAGNVIVPENDEQTKFSLHYSLAASLLHGQFGFDHLKADAVTDDVKSLIEKISIVVDETMEDAAKGIRGCMVTVELNDGSHYSHTVTAPKGEAENPFTWEDLRSKLIDCAGELATEADCDALIRAIRTKSPEAAFLGIK